MVRALIVALAAAVAACSANPIPSVVPFIGRDPPLTPQPRAELAPGLTLALPTPPGFPETRTMQQTVRAHYGERSAVVECLLSLSPEEVIVVLTAVSGPRLATVTWNANGVRSEVLPIAPGIPAENIVADMFISIWPAEVVRSALPQGVELVEGEHGARTIRQGEAAILEVTPDPADPNRIMVRNLALGYEVAIVSRTLE